jgi:Mor family transcriptional regulator
VDAIEGRISAEEDFMARIGKNQLVKLQKKYHTDESIAQLYHISRQAVHQLRKKYALAPVDSKYLIRNQTIGDLYKNGTTAARLARKFRISITHVYRIVRKTRDFPAQQYKSSIIKETVPLDKELKNASQRF